MFLIDADLAQGSGKNITQNITEIGSSNEPNPLNIGSPTSARTRDLRINSPSEKWSESRIQLGFPGFRLGNRLADFALISPRSPQITLFQFPSTLSSDALRKLVKFIVRQSPESAPGIGPMSAIDRHRHIIKRARQAGVDPKPTFAAL